MDNREMLAMFVAGGNMRNAEPSPAMDADRKQELQRRLVALREGGKIVDADAAPLDFREAINAREALASAKAQERLDVPRWNANHPVMKGIYQAHDAIAGIPAPGGIGVILLIVFVFFLVLIPVTSGGPTRTLLLWDVLLGKKTLPPLTRDARSTNENNTSDKGWHPGTGSTGTTASTGGALATTGAAITAFNTESVYQPDLGATL